MSWRGFAWGAQSPEGKTDNMINYKEPHRGLWDLRGGIQMLSYLFFFFFLPVFCFGILSLVKSPGYYSLSVPAVLLIIPYSLWPTGSLSWDPWLCSCPLIPALLLVWGQYEYLLLKYNWQSWVLELAFWLTWLHISGLFTQVSSLSLPGPKPQQTSHRILLASCWMWLPDRDLGLQLL